MGCTSRFALFVVWSLDGDFEHDLLAIIQVRRTLSSCNCVSHAKTCCVLQYLTSLAALCQHFNSTPISSLYDAVDSNAYLRSILAPVFECRSRPLKRWNALVPVAQLPHELLSRILAYCAPCAGSAKDKKDDIRDLKKCGSRALEFTQVCREWRQIAIWTSATWTCIPFTRSRLVIDMIRWAENSTLDIVWDYSTCPTGQTKVHRRALRKALNIMKSKLFSPKLLALPSYPLQILRMVNQVARRDSPILNILRNLVLVCHAEITWDIEICRII
jgi:hypothetical protein